MHAVCAAMQHTEPRLLQAKLCLEHICPCFTRHASPALHDKVVSHCLIRLLVGSWTSPPSYLTNVVCVCMLAGETMISGYTGEAFRTDIFIGPVYYQRLRHMVSDKFQVCSASAASISALLQAAYCLYISLFGNQYVAHVLLKAIHYSSVSTLLK